MNRMHIHLSVSDLDSNIKFYSTMFGIEPTILESDYAKWRLENPSVNFAISNKGRENGLNHLGLELDSDEELNKVYKRWRVWVRWVIQMKLLYLMVFLLILTQIH